jgi:simple sugar transport system ATP-binding protein
VISRLQASGLGVIFITHKLSDAVAFGDRISVIKRGRNAGSIEPAELKSSAPEAAIARIVGMMFGSSAAEGASAPPVGKPGAPILQVTGLSVQRRADEVAVEDIGFTVHAGEILGIAGVEGNGQKPLAEALAGQRRITAGRLQIDGQDITASGVRARQRAGLRYVTDDRLGEGTVGDFGIGPNLLMKRVGDAAFWSMGFARAERIADYSTAKVAAFDVRTPGIGHRVAAMSGGNIQKLLLARELAGKPRLVIFNKPTYGLDRSNIAAAHRAILDQAQGGLGTIVISTDLDEILALSHRVAVMLGGAIVGIVSNGPDARSQIGELMIGHGVTVGGPAATERVA